MKKILAIVGGILAAVLVCGVLLVLVERRTYRNASRDVLQGRAAPPQGRAIIMDPSLAGQPNAADIYQQALPFALSLSKEESTKITAALRRPWTDPDGSLAALLQRQAPLMALARKGSVLPRFELGAGLEAITFGQGPPPMNGAVQGAKLLLLDGRRLLAEGHPAEALDNALAVLAMAGQFNREKNFAFLTEMISNMLVDVAFPLLSDLISSGLDEPRLAALRDTLQPLAETNAIGRGIQQELTGYGIIYAELLTKVWYIPPWTRRKMIFDVQRAHKDFADAVADGVRRNIPGIMEAEIARRRTHGEGPVSRPVSTKAADAGLQFMRDATQKYAFCLKIGLMNPQAYGDCTIAYPHVEKAPHYSKLINQINFVQSEATVLLAAVGVRLHERSRHEPPQTLQDLVPDFLPKVPLDNFDGFRPLRYALGPDSWTVYGVGPDRKDDGGTPRPYVENEDWSKPAEGDIVVTASRLRWAAPRRRSRSR